MSSSTTTTTTTRKELLRTRASSFCSAFLSNTPPSTILSTHFTPTPKITEHGPSHPSLPFLGTTFSGLLSSPSSTKGLTCDDYFSLLSQTLTYDPASMKFPPEEEFMVDEEAVVDGKKGVVSVVAKGVFRSRKTGRSWKETFIYRLSGFDEEGRIGWWEIWADTLSAWEAVNG